MMKKKAVVYDETIIGLDGSKLVSVQDLEILKNNDCLNVVQEITDTDIEIFGFHRFNFDPLTGKKIDWDALRKKYSND